ncbi:MAG: DUF4856 domain-containing protein, partial [Candidatus Kapabacteria bacterium]|nr:DUF4856 domain-containing protein [Candidatus Kapabacteria bacterium]
QGVSVSVTDLTALASALPMGSYADVVTAALPELAKASGGTYDPRRPVAENGQGGVYGSYLFDETGLEYEQVVDKGLYGAMLYAKAAKLMQTAATSADVDRILALFGADPAFPNSDKAAAPDRFAAAYAARRDKNDGKGMYTTITRALRTAKAAAAKGSDHDAEKMAAFTTIRSTWERALMATALNYLQSTVQTIASTNPTDADLAAALHAHSEAVGFVMGLMAVDAGDRIITDAAARDVLAKLQIPTQGPGTSYRMITEPVSTVTDLQAAITIIANVYGFSAADVEDFRNNWVNVQGRQ